MTERDALLRAVIQNPDDDTPRLIFADWLEEHGDPDRAAFIRCQVELAGRKNCRSCYRKTVAGRAFNKLAGDSLCIPCSVLRKEERGLLYANHNDWFPPPLGFSCGIDGSPNAQCTLFWNSNERRADNQLLSSRQIHALAHRGFLERLTLDWPTFRDHADTLTASHPIREVTLTTMPTYISFGGQYIIHLDEPPGFQDSPIKETIFDTVLGYEEMCKLFTGWLNEHWPRITFTLPPEQTVEIGWDTPSRTTPLADLLRFREMIESQSVDINPTSSPRSGHEPTA